MIWSFFFPSPSKKQGFVSILSYFPLKQTPHCFELDVDCVLATVNQNMPKGDSQDTWTSVKGVSAGAMLGARTAEPGFYRLN